MRKETAVTIGAMKLNAIVYNKPVRGGPAEMFSPLSERPFMLFFWARVTSLVGDNVVQVALAFAVLNLTDSAADLGFVLAARTVTMVVFLLAGGVWPTASLATP
jgi:hypothetical protein